MDMKSASANQRSFRNWMTHFCPLTHSLLFQFYKKILFLYFYEFYCFWEWKVWTETTKGIQTHNHRPNVSLYQDISGLVRTSLNLRTRVSSWTSTVHFITGFQDPGLVHGYDRTTRTARNVTCDLTCTFFSEFGMVQTWFLNSCLLNLYRHTHLFLTVSKMGWVCLSEIEHEFFSL